MYLISHLSVFCELSPSKINKRLSKSSLVRLQPGGSVQVPEIDEVKPDVGSNFMSKQIREATEESNTKQYI